MPTIQRKPTPKREGQIQDEIRLELGMEPGLVLFRLNNGAFRAIGQGGKEIVVQAGLKSAPDLLGYLTVEIPGRIIGQFFALEVKRPGELPRPLDVLKKLAGEYTRRGIPVPASAQHELDQQLWADLARRHGCFVAFVTSVEEARAAVQRALEGAHE
jgi:uncharacterized protein involved in response to NO